MRRSHHRRTPAPCRRSTRTPACRPATHTYAPRCPRSCSGAGRPRRKYSCCSGRCCCSPRSSDGGDVAYVVIAVVIAAVGSVITLPADGSNFSITGQRASALLLAYGLFYCKSSITSDFVWKIRYRLEGCSSSFISSWLELFLSGDSYLLLEKWKETGVQYVHTLPPQIVMPQEAIRIL